MAPQHWMQCRSIREPKSYIMSHNLSTLNKEKLHELFLNESIRFTEGMDNGMPFDELKKISMLLREITLQLQEKNGLGNGS